MKNLTKYFLASIFSFSLIVFTQFALAQDPNCEITKVNGGGFTTTIQSVVNNCDGTYTFVLRVDHDGCSGPSCKELSHYSVEAIPGTYSNVSVQVLSGGMTYTNIDLGPNLGSDPFQGFKVDGTDGIGGGQAGSFTITYTMTSIQNQRASAKAGTDPQMVTFNSELDFTYVMNCNNTNCGVDPDTDNDGCYDIDDMFPTDPARCYEIAGNWGTLAYEDLWPSKGDYDFNDLVCIYKYTSVYNAENQVVDLKAKYYITAVGASFNNGFGVQFDNLLPSQIASVTGNILDKGYVTTNANGTEAGQAKAVVIMFDNTESILNRAGGSFFNTLENGFVGTSDTVNVTITFANPISAASLGSIPFNPFLIKNGNRDFEIHLPDKLPTSLADPANFGTFEDDTRPGDGKYYMSDNNLPWGLHVPVVLDHMIEKIEINQGYLKFGNWAQTRGANNPDWYLNEPGYRDASKIWEP